MKFTLKGPFKKRQKRQVDPKILLDKLEESLNYVEMRRVATRLRQICTEKKKQSVAFLSFGCGEGKSMVVAGLAMFMARNFGQKILIVETATYHRAGAVKLDALFQLDQVELGQPTPSPVFPGVDMIRIKDRARKGYYSRDTHDVEVVLAEVGGKYDCILVDTAALELKNRQNYDAQAIAGCVDGVVIVKSRLDLSPEFEAQVLEDLRSMDLEFLGVIANSGALA